MGLHRRGGARREEARERRMTYENVADFYPHHHPQQEPSMTTPATPQIDDKLLIDLENALIVDIDSNLGIAKKLAEAGDPARAVLHTMSAAIHLGYLQGRARDMMAPHILAARERLNVGVLSMAAGVAPSRTRKRSKKEASA
jgi:hypothetical protein